jgi:methylated-DNA-[protein]-cysteine S-methyltransferase
MNNLGFTLMNTPIGLIYIVGNMDTILGVFIGEADFYEYKQKVAIDIESRPEWPILIEAKDQMMQYFQGKRIHFHLPLKQDGTEFQMKVWKELCSIPFGETRSYQDIAIAIGNPKAVRAIGQANKRNQFPILVPCHRVIGKDKSLTGYAGTRTDIKDNLLTLEGALFMKKNK